MTELRVIWIVNRSYLHEDFVDEALPPKRKTIDPAYPPKDKRIENSAKTDSAMEIEVEKNDSKFEANFFFSCIDFIDATHTFFHPEKGKLWFRLLSLNYNFGWALFLGFFLVW